MSAPSVTLRPVPDDDRDRVAARLDAAGLPSEDVRTVRARFFEAIDDGTSVGGCGLERYGTDALLRSLVVEEARRGRGYGTAICEAVATRAREDGVETLYLLTTTAVGFFDRRGFERIDRDAVPSRLRGSRQFADLCPASATCMRRRL